MSATPLIPGRYAFQVLFLSVQHFRKGPELGFPQFVGQRLGRARFTYMGMTWTPKTEAALM